MTEARSSRPSSSRSVVRRTLFSSIGDLLHGRLTPLDPATTPVTEASLPGPLAEMVCDVTKQTRLWPSEKRNVARELAAHFEDGLAGGATVEELRGSFGDPRHAARLIRRAKIRQRPLIWRVPAGIARGFAILCGVLITIYVVLLIWTNLGSANPSHNFWREYNAPVLATPAEERAWPVYRRAFLMLQGDQGELLDDVESTEHEQWGDVVALLRENQESLALFRAGAQRRVLGYIHTPRTDAGLQRSVAAFLGRSEPVSGTPTAQTIDDNPPLISMPLPALSPLRMACRMLWQDALLALEEDDPERAISDVDAALGVGRQLDHEHAHLITQLVSIWCISGTCGFLQDQLIERPDALSERQWMELAHRVAAIRDGERISLNFAAERDFFADTLQRLYTEAGYPAPDFWPQVMSISANGTAEEAFGPYYGPLTAPIAAAGIADRAALQAKYDQIMDMYAAFAAQPMWERETDRASETIMEIMVDPLERWYYLPIRLLMPSLTRASTMGSWATQERDATCTAIALELYRRAHGAWPASLAELTPRYLPGVPLDRHDGRTLKYRFVDGHPLLYSVGVDRDDDGGRLIAESTRFGLRSPAARNRRARDWEPPATIARARGTDDERYYDGDWILWPRVKGD